MDFPRIFNVNLRLIWPKCYLRNCWLHCIHTWCVNLFLTTDWFSAIMIFYDPNAFCVHSPYFPFWFLSAVVYFVNWEWLVRMWIHIARGRHAWDPSSPSFRAYGSVCNQMYLHAQWTRKKCGGFTSHQKKSGCGNIIWLSFVALDGNFVWFSSKKGK